MSQPDPLAALRDQIRAATDAAERLVGDARAERPAHDARAERPAHDARADAIRPPRPPSGDGGLPAEVAALARLLEVLRDLLPPELEHQLADLIRQLLRVLRALIDWALVRLEAGGPDGEVEVEDIPIG